MFESDSEYHGARSKKIMLLLMGLLVVSSIRAAATGTSMPNALMLNGQQLATRTVQREKILWEYSTAKKPFLLKI